MIGAHHGLRRDLDHQQHPDGAVSVPRREADLAGLTTMRHGEAAGGPWALRNDMNTWRGVAPTTAYSACLARPNRKQVLASAHPDQSRRLYADAAGAASPSITGDAAPPIEEFC